MAEVILATALAALILREPVGWRRWTATAVGFVGVAIMVRPFGAGVDPYAWVALLGAAFGAVNMVILRVGAGTDRIETVLFWQNMVVLVIVTPVALWVWETPTLVQAAILLVMAMIFTAGMWLMTAALRLGETSALAPLHYLRLLMMAVAGWFIYAEVPSLSTVVGAVLVLGAATYTISRNARKQVPQPPAPTVT
jgi:drug/metabolite transporter (DMT)-like permease